MVNTGISNRYSISDEGNTRIRVIVSSLDKSVNYPSSLEWSVYDFGDTYYGLTVNPDMTYFLCSSMTRKLQEVFNFLNRVSFRSRYYNHSRGCPLLVQKDF